MAENPVDDEYESLNTYFPDEEVNLVEEAVEDDNQIWKLYFDGVVNIKGVGIGQILVSPTRQHYPSLARIRFFCTNNTAEYEAWIMGLNMAINLNVHELFMMGDSALPIWQAQGDWETQDIKLIAYRQCAPFHFISWGIDVIGPIEPKASNGHKFVSVAIDYFTKWVEAITLKVVTKKAVVDSVYSIIICQFGIPKTIITNNVANLNSHMMKEICEQFKIEHRNSTPYQPRANGVVEGENKNIKKILRKMVLGSRQWHEKLPFALLGYRTIIRTSVGATNYLLV
ncbi:uncharacterized protein [Nicotiana tomentosiformis]|uniref:uncharacterized protein n=1 Tax=Nicotiana tomentosiformis TaxID=4098 RepID=UPI00388C4759